MTNSDDHAGVLRGMLERIAPHRNIGSRDDQREANREYEALRFALEAMGEVAALRKEVAGWKRTYEHDCEKLIDRATAAEAALAKVRGCQRYDVEEIGDGIRSWLRDEPRATGPYLLASEVFGALGEQT